MGKLGLVMHGVLATAAATVLLVGSQGEAASIVQTANGQATVATLESDVAHTPTSASVSALVSAYLEREQPGLAQAVLDAHPELDDARTTHERARVALAQGEVDHALSLSQLALTMCETDADGPRACPAWLVAKSIRQVSLLEAMQRAGIQDPATDPVRARAALLNGSREVRLAALP
jgi:hypothetical protein